MGRPTIAITGEDAEEAGRELQALLLAEVGDEGTRSAPGEVDAAGRKVDAKTLAIASFILSLPGAIKSTVDLAEKIGLIKVLDGILAWAKRRGRGGTRIALLSGEGKSVDLARAEAGDVVEALAESEESGRTQGTK